MRIRNSIRGVVHPSLHWSVRPSGSTNFFSVLLLFLFFFLSFSFSFSFSFSRMMDRLREGKINRRKDGCVDVWIFTHLFYRKSTLKDSALKQNVLTQSYRMPIKHGMLRRISNGYKGIIQLYHQDHSETFRHPEPIQRPS